MGNCVSRRTNLSCYSYSSDSSSDETQGSAIIPYTPKQSLHPTITRLDSTNGLSSHNRTSSPSAAHLPKRSNSDAQTSGLNHGSDHEKIGATSACAAKFSEPYLNGGYWPLWRHYGGVASPFLQLDTVTHVHYAFARLEENGVVHIPKEKALCELTDSNAKTNTRMRVWTRHKKENPSLKITIAIGGGGDSVAKTFADVCANPRKRFTFVRTVKALVEKYNLDGVDVDWEYPAGHLEAKLYLQLLTELRQTLGWHRWLTTALPAGQWALKSLDLQQVAKIVDFINLMAYDFVGPTFANVYQTGHHAQLYAPDLRNKDIVTFSAARAVEYLLQRGVSSRKIMLGVPTYGRCFKGALAPGERYEGPGSGIDATYEVKDLPRPGMVETFDQSVVAAYASGNGEFITYDNNECVRKKAEYVKQKNLRGLFYWHLAGDRDGDDSLIKRGHEVLVKHLQVSRPQAVAGLGSEQS